MQDSSVIQDVRALLRNYRDYLDASIADLVDNGMKSAARYERQRVGDVLRKLGKDG